MIETIDDIIEEMADAIGRWGAHFDDHPEGSACECRMCFTVGLKQRILDAVEIENAIEKHHAYKRKQSPDKVLASLLQEAGAIPVVTCPTCEGSGKVKCLGSGVTAPA